MARIPEKLRVKINVIAFFVLGLGLVFAMATRVLSVLEPRYAVRAIFPDAGGVFTNQEVTYRGVTVGQVGAMDLVEDGVEITLLIEDDYEIPAEGVEARVMFKSAVGEQFVDILPASEGAPYLEDGDVIPIERTSIPVSTQELLSTLEAVLRGVPPESLEGAIDALGIGLTGRGHDLATILESSADLAVLFAERAPEVQGILRSGTKVGGAFLRSRADFVRAIERLVVVGDSLADSTPDLENLLRNTNLASDEIVALLRRNDAAVNRLIVELAEVNDLQAEHADDLRRLFVHLPDALRGVNRSFEPATGLIRFGLVNDSSNPGCSYGTERRKPHDRSRSRPPKQPSCKSVARDQGASLTSGVAALATRSETTMLPERMTDWSWSLLYLNGF